MVECDLNIDEWSGQKKCGVCCSCCGVILLIILLSMSWTSIDYNEYGLYYTWTNKEPEKDAYTTGRHFVGPTGKFYLFPSTIQTVDFSSTGNQNSIKVRSLDSKDIEVEISFDYKFRKDQLYNVYKLHQFKAEESYVTNAREKLRNAGGKFYAIKFLAEAGRTEIEAEMRKVMKEIVEPRFDSSGKFLGGGSDLIDLQLRRVILPTNSELDAMMLRLVELEITPITSTLQGELQRYTTETSTFVNNEKLVTTKYLAGNTTNIEAQELIIKQKATLIRENTTSAVARIQNDVNVIIKDFNSVTNQLLAAIDGKTSKTVAATTQNVTAISNKIAELSADHEARVSELKATADAYVLQTKQETEAATTKVLSTALKESFQTWASGIGFSAEDLADYTFAESLGEHNMSRIHIDLQKPASLGLPGQQSLYYESLDEN